MALMGTMNLLLILLVKLSFYEGNIMVRVPDVGSTVFT